VNEGAPMSEQEHYEEITQRLAGLHAQLGLQLQAAEIRHLHFNGAKGETERYDDIGRESALSYGIYNPLAIKAYLAIGGAGATERDGALAIPAKAALILPIAIAEGVKVGVDATELGENQALIWRLKFPTPQPFFFGAL
jgi:hypothetical protein